MTTVGIIANPVSGKDIRRLVAHGSVFDNQEKVRIVRRVLMGLSELGIQRVFYMPDYYAIVDRAARGCNTTVKTEAIPMRIENNQDDSTRAGQWMEAQGADCLIVLGGDGTCRAVSKGTTEVPLMPISTGTNNVFPYMVEATIAGIAAGLVACGEVSVEQGTFRSCCLEVLVNENVVDSALVDAAVYNDRFIASRAIWDMTKVSQIFLTRCSPDSIGLSAIGGQLYTIAPQKAQGLHLVLGGGSRSVKAAIAPGLFQNVTLQSDKLIRVGESLSVLSTPCVLALDGEREVEVSKGSNASVRLSNSGPVVIDVYKTMATAQKMGLFVGT